MSGGEEYVRKVREETMRQGQALLLENERLRRLVALHEHERDQLRSALELAQQGLQRQQDLQRELEQRLQLAEEEGQRFSRSYLDVERQNSDLANLYVASYRLHGTLDRQEVLLSIQEILSNLVGCEEAGVFEVEPGSGRLHLAGSFGIDAARFAHLTVGEGVIGGTAAGGELFVARPDGVRPAPPEEDLTACIPITIEGRVMGVIALFRLLSHKAGLAEVDHEIPRGNSRQ